MRRFLFAATLLASLVPAVGNAAGYQTASAPNGADPALELTIWYPSAAKPSVIHEGPFDMTVASGAAPRAGQYPLIVMSHGAGGTGLGSSDTGVALADAGFVVVAPTHWGDNYRDHSHAFARQNFISRPQQVSRVIDYMTQQWTSHGIVDADRVGVMGHSAGGATALLLAGGVMDWARITARCAKLANDWGCEQARKAGVQPDTTPPPPVTGADQRVKAVLVMAPALSEGFDPHGLDAVRIPVSIWASAKDTIVTDAALLHDQFGARAEYYVVPDAGHFAFLTPCNDWLKSLAPEICENPPGFDRAAFLTGFQKAAASFFKANLK